MQLFFRKEEEKREPILTPGDDRDVPRQVVADTTTPSSPPLDAKDGCRYWNHFLLDSRIASSVASH